MLTFITGASGHIGTNLVRALLVEGRPLRVAAHKDVRGLAGLPVARVACDITSRPQVLAALAGVDTVFHCAGQIAISRKSEQGMLDVNIRGTENLVQCALAQGVRRFVFFSSIHALSSQPEHGTIDETRPLVAGRSRMLYDFSKAEAERIVLAAAGKGLDVVIVNPTAVIGPFDFKPSLLGSFIITLCLNRIPLLVGGGFNWVDVRDVVAGALAAEKQGRRGERYILAGHWQSVQELTRLIGKQSGKVVIKKTVPHWLAHLGVPFFALAAALTGKQPLFTHDSLRTLQHHRYISAKKAEAELGYTSRPLEETIRDTVGWFREHGFIRQ